MFVYDGYKGSILSSHYGCGRDAHIIDSHRTVSSRKLPAMLPRSSFSAINCRRIH